MSNRNATAGFPNSILTLLIIRVCNEQVPLSIDHMGVEVVWAGWVVGIKPIIDKNRVCFVGDVDEGCAHLNRIAPFPNIWIRIAWIDELVLLNDVFAAVIFEVFDIQNLSVWIVVNTNDGGVVWIGHIHDVHVIPSGQVCICSFAIGGSCNLNLGVTWCGQGIEIEKGHIISARHVLGSVGMVVTFVLIERVHFIEND